MAKQDVRAGVKPAEFVPDTVTMTLELVTPEQAQEWLQANGAVRKVRRHVVDRYARDMKDGNWTLTAAAVAFDEDDDLLDGQHRLLACLKAGVPFWTWVMRGMTHVMQRNTDMGAKRSLADVLAWYGETQRTTLAGSIRLGWRWSHGLVTTKQQPTVAEALAWLDRNPSIRSGTAVASRVNKVLGVPATVVVVWLHQARMINPGEAVAFLECVIDGSGLASGSGPLLYRNWCFNQMNRYGSRQRPDQISNLAILVKAWNLFAKNERRQTLAWRRGGVRGEPFPQLLDLEGSPWPVRDELVGDEPDNG